MFYDDLAERQTIIKEDLIMNPTIPIQEKANLTIDEAAAYSNIGRHTLRRLAKQDHCPFALWVGTKCLIKREPFEEFLKNAYSI